MTDYRDEEDDTDAIADAQYKRNAEPPWEKLQPLDRVLLCVFGGIVLCIVALILRAG